MDPERRRRRISEGTARLLLAKATATLHCNEAAAHLKAEHYQEALDSYTAVSFPNYQSPVRIIILRSPSTPSAI